MIEGFVTVKKQLVLTSVARGGSGEPPFCVVVLRTWDLIFLSCGNGWGLLRTLGFQCVAGAEHCAAEWGTGGDEAARKGRLVKDEDG